MIYETLAALIAGSLIAITAVYLLLIRVRMDPSVKRLAAITFQYSARLMGVEPKGSVPPVVLKKDIFKVKGVIVIGNYTWYRLGKWMLWERVTVVDDSSYLFSNLVHEMTHVHRVRRGEATTEAEAEAIEALAMKEL